MLNLKNRNNYIRNLIVKLTDYKLLKSILTIPYIFSEKIIIYVFTKYPQVIGIYYCRSRKTEDFTPFASDLDLTIICKFKNEIDEITFLDSINYKIKCLRLIFPFFDQPTILDESELKNLNIFGKLRLKTDILGWKSATSLPPLCLNTQGEIEKSDLILSAWSEIILSLTKLNKFHSTMKLTRIEHRDFIKCIADILYSFEVFKTFKIKRRDCLESFFSNIIVSEELKSISSIIHNKKLLITDRDKRIECILNLQKICHTEAETLVANNQDFNVKTLEQEVCPPVYEIEQIIQNLRNSKITGDFSIYYNGDYFFILDDSYFKTQTLIEFKIILQKIANTFLKLKIKKNYTLLSQPMFNLASFFIFHNKSFLEKKDDCYVYKKIKYYKLNPKITTLTKKKLLSRLATQSRNLRDCYLLDNRDKLEKFTLTYLTNLHKIFMEKTPKFYPPHKLPLNKHTLFKIAHAKIAASKNLFK